MKLLRLITAFFVISCLLHGCATREKHTYYVNEMGEVSVIDDDLSSELQLVASTMTYAMMPVIQSGKNMRYPSRWPTGVKPLVVIVEVDNRTEEFVDSHLVTDAIRTALRSQDALLTLDNELPLPDVHRFVSLREEKPELELPGVRLPRQGTSLPLAIPGKDEPPLTQRFKRVPLQPAPVRTSEALLPKRMPLSGEKWQDTNMSSRVFLTLMSSSAPDTPLSSHASDGLAPVRMSILTPSPNRSKPFESNAQKRERMLHLLEAQLKERDVQGYAPVYAIRTVLLPFADRPADEGRKNKKEPYMFKMFVEDVRSETIKWASAWEVRKASLISSIAGAGNDTGNSYRAATPDTRQSTEQGDNSMLADSIRDFQNVTESIRNIGTLREAIQQ
jgi:hypothetical protein